MSWQSYVDTNLVGTGTVSQAAIVGLKGGVWASSSGFNVSGTWPLMEEILAAVNILERRPCFARDSLRQMCSC